MTINIGDCIPTPDSPLGPELEVDIPFIGELRSMTASLYDIMDPSEFLMKFMDKLSVALGPIRQFLEVLEVLIAIKSCFDAVVDAVSSLSPGPIFDCFSGLLEALQRLLKYIPPFQYIVTLVQVMALVIDLIDALMDFYIELDARISDLAGMLTIANEFADNNLVDMHTCAMTEVKTLLVASLDPLKVIKPIIMVLMEAIVRFVPDPDLQQAVDQFKQGFSDLEGLRDNMINSAGLPNITVLLTGLNTIRTVVVAGHNILGPLVGIAADKTNRAFPSLVNF